VSAIQAGGGKGGPRWLAFRWEMCFTRTPRTAEESAFCKRACSISCRRVTGSTAEGLDFSNARALPLAATEYNRVEYISVCVVYRNRVVVS
jgi:hypothetical protein